MFITCSQEPVTGAYREPTEVSSYAHNLIEIHFNIILQSVCLLSVRLLLGIPIDTLSHRSPSCYMYCPSLHVIKRNVLGENIFSDIYAVYYKMHFVIQT
jgi:hypothetical protein